LSRDVATHMAAELTFDLGAIGVAVVLVVSVADERGDDRDAVAVAARLPGETCESVDAEGLAGDVVPWRRPRGQACWSIQSVGTFAGC
jgi:hypothetical protein